MDQLIVLHEICDSFSKGLDRIKAIDPAAIEGSCSKEVCRLLEGAKLGIIDKEICSGLLDCFDDVYEMKRLGDICRKAGHYTIALKSYNKALLKNKDQSIKPVLFNNVGQVYVRCGDISRANVYYEKAFDGFESLGDSSGMAHVLGNIAGAYRKGKDWDNAVDNCYRCLKIFEGLGDDLGIAQATGSLGRIYADMGEQELAIRYLERSLHDFNRLGDNRSVAWILDHLGRISSAAKNWDEALKYFNKSIAAYEELGQDQSIGIVMSNIGRMYLEKGDAAAAVDQLEKAIKLMKRDMQPAYQNAIECIAAAYAIMAAASMQSAVSSHSEGFDMSSEDNLRLASQFYARSSDRYLELASTHGFDLTEIKVSASITRSLSYLAKLKAETSDAEAVALAERSASALDSAIVNSAGYMKDNIEALQRILIGVRETLSLGITGGEPWKLTKSISDSIEHLLSGACSQNEAGKCLCEVLKGLSGAIEAERQRADTSEQLKSIVSSLGRAKAAFESEETIPGRRNALEAVRAMELADGLIDIEQKDRTASSYSLVSDLLNYRAYRDILLIVGQILVEDAVSKVNKIDRIYVWDESLEPAKRYFEKEPAARELNEDKSIVSGCNEPLSWSVSDVEDLDDPASDDGVKIIVDRIEQNPIPKSYSSEGLHESADAGIGQLPFYDDMPIDGETEKKELGAADSADWNEYEKRSDYAVDDAEAFDNSAAGIGPFAKIPGLGCAFSQENGIKLIKAMIVAVIVLLSMDAILYLI